MLVGVGVVPVISFITFFIGVIMAYNKNVLASDKAPKAWADLLKPEFKGR